MNNTIKKIEEYKSRELNKAISKAEIGYKEAKKSYDDTGYDRYFNKMERCEKELQELQEYLHKDETVVKDLSTNEYREYLDMKENFKTLISKFFYMFADLNLPETSEVKGIQRLLEKYK